MGEFAGVLPAFVADFLPDASGINQGTFHVRIIIPRTFDKIQLTKNYLTKAGARETLRVHITSRNLNE